MLQYNPTVSGSLTITGSLTVTNGVIGTVSGVDVQIFSSSINQVISGIQSSTESSDAKFNTLSSVTSSALTRLTNIESKSASVDISISNINTFTSSNANQSLNSKTGSYATTGSNTFVGTTIMSGSTYVQGDLIVLGSSSIQYISASSVSIGTNIVQLNTSQPAVRFGGLSVQDSGSASGVTGSMFWDGCCNRWIYSNPSGVGYSGGVLMSGPRGSTLGNEPTLTCNYIAKSGGGDHLYDSCIIDDGTTTCFYNSSYINSTGQAYFNGSAQQMLTMIGSNTGGTSLLLQNTSTGGACWRIYSTGVGNGEGAGHMLFNNASGVKMMINSSGYVGINNSTPIDSLTVCGGIVSTKNTILTNCTAAIFDYNDSQCAGRMLSYKSTGSNLLFYTNYTGCGMAERVRIDACGNVGIGCSAPAYKLDILGGGGLRITDTEANIVLNSCGGGSGIWRLIGSTGATTKLFRIFDADNAIDRFNITAGGYIGMGHTTPPYNLTICCTGQVIINVRTSTTTSGSESGLLISTPDSIGLMSVGAADARGVNTAIRCDMVIGLRTGGRILFTTDPNANYHNLALTCGNSSGGGHLIPYTTGIQNLGCATNRFGTVYTSDLSLSNGIGDYTIVEGESDLFIYNNKQCKVYRFMLQEVCTECAIPKKS